MIRPPVVSGQFYPGNKNDLYKSVSAFMDSVPGEQPAIGLMSPHAGYIYSGAVAGKTLSSAAIPEEVVILGPNHHGRGQAAAVYASGSWQTPLGEVPIAEKLAGKVLVECPMTSADMVAHQFEHSLEVQVPFLQCRVPQLHILPICIGHMSLPMLLELGEGLARAMRQCERLPLIVASSDMTHYESGETARRKDFMALEKVLALDPQGLYQVVRENRISMCGVLPTVVMLQAAISLGATNANLVAYSNSGDVTGDQSEVVGYAGVRVF